jgi:hypothetical protein
MTTETFYFLAIMTAVITTFAGCFLVVAFGYSFNQWLKGLSFKNAFAYFWNNF